MSAPASSAASRARAAKLLADLLEVSCSGDVERLEGLLMAGVDVNGQHAMNGWYDGRARSLANPLKTNSHSQ